MVRIAVAAVLAAILFTSNAYPEQPTARELNIYYEYIEYIDPYVGASKEEFDKALKDFLSSHNLSEEELDNIVTKNEQADFTPEEERIVDEVFDTMKTMEAMGEDVDMDAACEKVAAKCHVSVKIVKGIMARALAKIW